MMIKVQEDFPELYFKSDKNDNLWLRCQECKSKMMKINFQNEASLLQFKKDKPNSLCKRCKKKKYIYYI